MPRWLFWCSRESDYTRGGLHLWYKDVTFFGQKQPEQAMHNNDIQTELPFKPTKPWECLKYQASNDMQGKCEHRCSPRVQVHAAYRLPGPWRCVGAGANDPWLQQAPAQLFTDIMLIVQGRVALWSMLLVDMFPDSKPVDNFAFWALILLYTDFCSISA